MHNINTVRHRKSYTPTRTYSQIPGKLPTYTYIFKPSALNTHSLRVLPKFKELQRDSKKTRVQIYLREKRREHRMDPIQRLKHDYPWIKTPLMVGAPMRLIALADLAVAISKAGMHI